MTVTDADVDAPVLTLPVGISAPATGPDGAAVTWNATAADAVDGAVDVECTPAPGTFPLGDTEVTCTAVDAAGNEATGSFTVTVADVTPPVLTLPADIVTPATTTTGATVTFTATAVDAVDGAVPVHCSPTPVEFPLGDTTVSCSAVDAAGNVANGAFVVTVAFTDLTPPVLALPTGIAAPAADATGADVTWTATAVDDVDGALPVACIPAAGRFPLGDTQVTCTAVDAAGNEATGSFVVSVTDQSPPVLSVPTSLTVDAEDLGGAAVGWSATAVDVVDGVVPVMCTPGPGRFPLGDTEVTCTAVDAAGNEATGSFTVTVNDAELFGAVRIAAGATHSCALMVDTTVRCWGDNFYGQLGSGTTGGTNHSPLTVTGLTGATDITTGPTHSCAVLTNGTARCWGSNEYGQLGTGSASPSYSGAPVTVTGLTGATAISTGRSHTCALLADGTARCWGLNSGQLGTGTTGGRIYTPATVTGLTGATNITTGHSHSCAVLTDGTARCWGYNLGGQLGNGTNTDTTTPTPVTALTGATNISGGTSHTCALLHQHQPPRHRRRDRLSAGDRSARRRSRAGEGDPQRHPGAGADGPRRRGLESDLAAQLGRDQRLHDRHPEAGRRRRVEAVGEAPAVVGDRHVELAAVAAQLHHDVDGIRRVGLVGHGVLHDVLEELGEHDRHRGRRR